MACINVSCREFFDDYDRNFLPDPNDPRGLHQNDDLTRLEKRYRTEVIGRVVQALLARRAARLAEAQGGNPPPDNFNNDLSSEDVGMLARLQLHLFRKHFSDGRGGIDYDRAQCCFEKFANGELRDPNNPKAGAPDGDFFFLFAEFALAAMQFGHDRDIWARLLEIFVKCQEIFISAYPPTGGGSGLGRNREFDPAGQVDEETKRKLRQKYGEMKPSELEKEYGENLKKGAEQKPATPGSGGGTTPPGGGTTPPGGGTTPPGGGTTPPGGGNNNDLHDLIHTLLEALEHLLRELCRPRNN